MKIALFLFDNNSLSRWQRILVCSFGVFFAYLLDVVSKEEYVHRSLQSRYFSFAQGLFFLVPIYLFNKEKVEPWTVYVKLSAFVMSWHGSGSSAFLSCPAQTLFRSTSIKVLQAMIGWASIPSLRQQFPVHEFKSLLLLLVGLILFILADAPNFNIISVLKIAGGLFMESLMLNMLEGIFMSHDDQLTQIMKSLFWLLISSQLIDFATRELKPAWISCAQHPYIYGVLLSEACSTHFQGQLSVISVMALLGSLTTSMINKPLQLTPQTTSPSEDEDNNKSQIGTQEVEDNKETSNLV